MTLERKFSPMLMSTPMVQAALADKKTQTRQPLKVMPRLSYDLDWLGEFLKSDRPRLLERCPYGNLGDVIWVRETFHYITDATTGEFISYGYKADKTWKGAVWKPAIHMPKKACRLFLEIVEIKMERLQDISYQDAANEGVEELGNGWKNYLTIKGKKLPEDWNNTYTSFQSLWESIYGGKKWVANPWVWVVIFKRINKPNNFK